MKMKKDSQSTVIAIQQGDKGKTISNPPPDYELAADDYLIFIGSYQLERGVEGERGRGGRGGRGGEGEMGRWGDGEMGRWGDGESDKNILIINN